LVPKVVETEAGWEILHEVVLRRESLQFGPEFGTLYVKKSEIWKSHDDYIEVDGLSFELVSSL